MDEQIQLVNHQSDYISN